MNQKGVKTGVPRKKKKPDLPVQNLASHMGPLSKNLLQVFATSLRKVSTQCAKRFEYGILGVTISYLISMVNGSYFVVIIVIR